MFPFGRCVFEGNSARWRNMRTPAPRTSVHVVGTCHQVCEDGSLVISISEITFNVAPAAFVGGAPGQGSDSPVSPSAKQCCFNAIAPPGSPS